MPVNVVNKTLGTELEVGDVILTRGAQRHANRRHPEDYPKCLPHLASVIANPRYIGDDHTNSGIEIWGYVATLGALVLVAVELIPDDEGRYHISSFYMVSEKKADARRLKGFLKVAQ
ncbi:conserved hypothetical protein [Bradyrhizobium oligotrophicum S58]|uniref:Phage-Barnase-EndoU-ColicinE5/D-RelE like nuclease 3 domain-containing protein n=2 Tax=Bradyrhizobium oligotrophicum TaxID=44255 RepID=M4Z4A3_9BRAD|nr:PBECR2 nuclease fold domain-containing protein [Bradyrhizobium oligotrophicum]BAM87706.1 conserved hypothetical protein [Bradyrhizobium oligotrophicum S58]